MQYLIQLVEANYLNLMGIWLTSFFVLLKILKYFFNSLLDPIVTAVFLIVSPGIAGVIFVYIYWPGDFEFTIKSFTLILAFLLYIIGMRIGFNYKNTISGEYFLNQDFFWQSLLLVISILVILLNIFLNGNFEDSDPSKRFTNVSYPILNYFSIAVAGYPAGILCFTRNVKIIYFSLLSIILITVVQFFVGTSKTFFLSWLFIYLNWHFSRGRFNKNDFITSLRKFSFSYSIVKIILLSIIIGGGGLIIMITNGITDFINLFIRFIMSFDSPILFLITDDVHLSTSSSIVGFYSFIDVWFKPFIKNLMGNSYIFENISQYLTYEMTGYRATDYSETGWQPNNNMIVDFLVLHGYWGVLFSFLSGYVVGFVVNFAKNSHQISKNKFPIFMLLILSPFYILTDTQSFITSLILGYFIIFFVNFICFIIKNQKGKYY